MIFAKPTAKQLDESNVMVKQHKRSQGRQRVVPVKVLRDPIQRFLPPAGRYYDQSTLNGFATFLDNKKRCVLCWNMKSAGEACKCDNNCAICDTKQHRGVECSMIYADNKWWQAHGHGLRKKAQLRPKPGECAYLVVANVLTDWKKLKGPAVANMDNPAVKAFYKGKEAPQRLTGMPPGLRPTPAATKAKARTIPFIFEPDDEESTGAPGNGDDRRTPSSAATIQSIAVQHSIRAPHTNSGQLKEAGKATDSTQNGSLTAEKDDNLFGQQDDNWKSPSYHEGKHYATMTPLSIRLAVTSAQQFAVIKRRNVSNGNEVRTYLDPRLQARTQREHEACSPQPWSANATTPTYEDKNDSVVKRCLWELEEARKVIRAKDRRIQELELALHESEGWTDAVTYRAGQKRPRKSAQQFGGGVNIL